MSESVVLSLIQFPCGVPLCCFVKRSSQQKHTRSRAREHVQNVTLFYGLNAVKLHLGDKGQPLVKGNFGTLG